MFLPCNTGWRGTHNVVQAGLELTSALLSLSLECWDYICVSQCLGQYSWPKGPVSYLWNSGNNAVSPKEHLSLGKRSREPATLQNRQFHVPLTIWSTQQSQLCSLLFAAGDRDVRNTVLSRKKDGSGKETVKPEALLISACSTSSLRNPHPLESLSSCTKIKALQRNPSNAAGCTQTQANRAPGLWPCHYWSTHREPQIFLFIRRYVMEVSSLSCALMADNLPGTGYIFLSKYIYPSFQRGQQQEARLVRKVHALPSHALSL